MHQNSKMMILHINLLAFLQNQVQLKFKQIIFLLSKVDANFPLILLFIKIFLLFSPSANKLIGLYSESFHSPLSIYSVVKVANFSLNLGVYLAPFLIKKYLIVIVYANFLSINYFASGEPNFIVFNY